MGLAGRQFGLLSDNLLQLTIVTADGTIRTASPKRNPDLFWACRGGGGGNFGIVTSFTFRVHRARSAALLQRQLALGGGQLGARRLAAAAARRAERADLDLPPADQRRRRARGQRQRPVLRLAERACGG